MLNPWNFMFVCYWKNSDNKGAGWCEAFKFNLLIKLDEDTIWGNPVQTWEESLYMWGEGGFFCSVCTCVGLAEAWKCRSPVRNRYSSLKKNFELLLIVFWFALSKTLILDFMFLNVYSSLRIVNAGGMAISKAVSHLSVSGPSTWIKSAFLNSCM